jgi:hypothetical protein
MTFHEFDALRDALAAADFDRPRRSSRTHT